MRKIESITTTVKNNSSVINVFTAKVYRDSEWQEWRVKFYVDGAHLVNADYHTNDKVDAQGMARSKGWIRNHSA
jgi:hypothetical protein